MLHGNPFYFHSLRNLVVGFGDVFNNVQIQRKDSSGNIDKTIKVPLEFARRQKYIGVLREDAVKHGTASQPNIETVLPKMSYDFVGIEPDATRKLNSLNTQKRPPPGAGDTDYLKQLQGVPYTISIELSIYTYGLDEMLQVTEQILPYFTPDYNITIIEIPELNITRDVPIILTGVEPTDSFEGVFDDYRVIEWSMQFTAAIEFYPPVLQGNVIRTTIANIREQEDQVSQRSTQTVNPSDANEDDTYTVDKVLEDEPTI